jgi:hypothetical protein
MPARRERLGRTIFEIFLLKGASLQNMGWKAAKLLAGSATRRDSAIIVYDRLNGVTLMYDESVQVFPIDCVYGIIEVKSALSKTEFLDALEKIKAFKAMAPSGAVSHSLGGGFTRISPRSRPFGVVFAYS